MSVLLFIERVVEVARGKVSCRFSEMPYLRMGMSGRGGGWEETCGLCMTRTYALASVGLLFPLDCCAPLNLWELGVFHMPMRLSCLHQGLSQVVRLRWKFLPHTALSTSLSPASHHPRPSQPGDCFPSTGSHFLQQ